MPLLLLCLPKLKAEESVSKESFCDRTLSDPTGTLEAEDFKANVSWIKTGEHLALNVRAEWPRASRTLPFEPWDSQLHYTVSTAEVSFS